MLRLRGGFAGWWRPLPAFTELAVAPLGKGLFEYLEEKKGKGRENEGHDGAKTAVSESKRRKRLEPWHIKAKRLGGINPTFHKLIEAQRWQDRLACLCRVEWCVVLFYDENISRDVAVRAIASATQCTRLKAFCKALTIGHPLFRGNRTYGTIFTGSWERCRAVFDRLVNHSPLVATVCPLQRTFLA